MHKAFTYCPRCQNLLGATPSFAGPPSKFWLECTNPICNTFVNTYIAQPHQAAVHIDAHRYIGNFGAYGTGKTLTSAQEALKHALITPNGNLLIGANVASQYEQTIRRDIETDIPAAFVKDYSNQKSYMDLINGARIMYRPFYDADNLRSYNLSFFAIIEASEVKGETFHQLKTRLRNMAASVPETFEDGTLVTYYDSQDRERVLTKADWRKGIVESNPDSGWIRTDVLNNASTITKHGMVEDTFEINPTLADPAISVHVAATDVNQYLPEHFIRDNIKNKPAWWVARYINASFQYAEGKVYPAAMRCVVPTFAVSPSWLRIVAFDYGLSDDSVFLFGAIDEMGGILYIYKEVRVNNRNIEELATLFKQNTQDIPVGGWYSVPIIDPKSGSKRDYNKESLIALFAQQGIIFKPGYIHVDPRVFRTNTYFESGKLKIMDCCPGLITELREYKFPERTLSKPNTKDKPVDKDNHGVNALEWICMDLPESPTSLSLAIYNRLGVNITGPKEEQAPPHMWQLEDDNHASLDTGETLFGMRPLKDYF